MLRLATLVLTVLLPVLHLKAQTTARSAFEAATVKLARPDEAPRNQVLRVGPDRLSIPSMTLSALVYAAYGDGGFNTSMSVRGGPDWGQQNGLFHRGSLLGTRYAAATAPHAAGSA